MRAPPYPREYVGLPARTLNRRRSHPITVGPVEIAVVALALSVFAFWIWAVVDCLVNEPEGSVEKLVWVLVLLGFNIVGAILYVIIRRPRRSSPSPG